MIKREVKRLAWEGEIEVFTDEQTDKKYRRIVGGMAWPYAEKPGFAVVIAEDYKEDPNLKDRHLRVIREEEEADVADLVRRCQDLHEECQTQYFYGNTSNKGMMAFFYHLNRGEDAQSRFYFSQARHADDPNGMGYYLPVIKEHLKVNRKILHFGEGSKLAGCLAQAGAEALNQDPSEYPPIAALGYALTYLYTVKSEPPRQKPNRKGSSWAA